MFPDCSLFATAHSKIFKIVRYKLKTMKNTFFYKFLFLLLMSEFFLLPASVHAQEMEPRAYSNAPIGMNFLLMGYGHSEGGLLFDPSVPVRGANANVDIGVLGFAHVFELLGQSAKYGLALPYADLDANGLLEGEYRERIVSGFADPTFMLSFNFSGAPALHLKQFGQYKQDTIVGATIKVTAPAGQYDNEKLINLGTNRWSIKPEIGISQASGKWVFEGAAAITFFTDNNDYSVNQKLEQSAIYSTQGHVVYNFDRGMWGALDATYYTGGVSTINGIEKDNKLDNWRFGVTLAVPVNKYHSIKFAASSGISTRTGTDFDAFLLAWQYRWGGGI